MKNKLFTPIFFALIIIALTCGISNPIYAQNEASQNELNIKSSFLGRWKDIQDPGHLLEIYKEGTLFIIYTRSEKNDGSGSKKYTVIADRGNKIMVDYGTGSTPLSMSDDGTKITFLGIEYKK